MDDKPGASCGQAEPRTAPLWIGWQEYVDFPDWKIRRIKVKVDTGARTSALHALSYELRECPECGRVAVLQLACWRKHPERVLVVEMPVLRMVAVRNSSGLCELRPVIETVLQLGPIRKRVRLTITNRANMLFRMILGRSALEGDFVVDVSRRYLLKGK
jgi:hypothetical protein